MTRFVKPLLLDGYSTRTLACVRSWGQRGIAFAVGGESRWDMSLFSRYSRETFVYTSPKRNVAAFIADVNRFSRAFGADCIVPTSEAAIMACSRHRHELTAVPIVPPDPQIAMTFSKANTLSIAESVGVRVPRTVYVTTATREALDAANLPLPVVIKSECSEVMLDARAATSSRTTYAFTRAALIGDCTSRLSKGQNVLLQEFIDGYGVGVSGLFAEGEPVALFGHRRIRESNPLGGPSALAESIDIEPGLLDAATAIMKKVGFSGPAMVEFKVHRQTGEPYLMEINGRFWGTVPLAPVAGVDLPYLFWKMFNGIEIGPEEKAYEVGRRGRNLVGDTKCLFLCLKGKPSNWPGEFPRRWSSIRSYVQSFFDRRTSDLILTPDDPMPFFARLAQDFA
jgi:predicted ATP-grasp superfamily ATP-dependent carboligase